LQPAGNLGFADSRAIELPDLVGVDGCHYLPAQALAVLACAKPAMARPAGVVRSNASVGETKPAPR
jgi:hypothetical protein